jgi:hypothetical protein
MTYNGWTNWETWNSYNWISSDPGLWDMALDSMRCYDMNDIEDAAEQLRDEFFLIIQDLPDNIDPNEVDWKELAAAFMEE